MDGRPLRCHCEWHSRTNAAGLPATLGVAVRVRVTRRGGIAGIALRATVDTAELPNGDGARAESALRDLPWGRAAPEPGLPDEFRYELAIAEHDDDRSIILGERELPADLRPVLDVLAQRGQLYRPSS